MLSMMKVVEKRLFDETRSSGRVVRAVEFYTRAVGQCCTFVVERQVVEKYE